MLRTLSRVGYAPITARSASGYTYDEIVWFESDEAGGRNIESTPQGETYNIEADGLRLWGGETNTGYQHSIELLDIIDDIRKDWLGMEETTTGFLERVSNKEMPHFALVVASENFNSDKKYTLWTFYDSYVSARLTRNSKTQAQTFDPDFPTYTVDSVPRMSDTFVYSEKLVDTLPTTITEPTLKP